MQKYISEFIGTFILLVSIVGSGIAGQQYTNDQMVILVSHAVVIGSVSYTHLTLPTKRIV